MLSGRDAARDAGKPGGREEFSTLLEAREAYERDYILKKLDECHGNVSRTAEALGLERSTLYRKMKALGVNVKESSSRASVSARDAAVVGLVSRFPVRSGRAHSTGYQCRVPHVRRSLTASTMGLHPTLESCHSERSKRKSAFRTNHRNLIRSFYSPPRHSERSSESPYSPMSSPPHLPVSLSLSLPVSSPRLLGNPRLQPWASAAYPPQDGGFNPFGVCFPTTLERTAETTP